MHKEQSLGRWSRPSDRSRPPTSFCGGSCTHNTRWNAPRRQWTHCLHFLKLQSCQEKSPNVLELKDENTSMGRKAIKSLGNMRNGPQSSHEIQEMVWFPLLLHQMPGEILGKSCRGLFSSPTQWQVQEPLNSSARAMLTNRLKIVQCSEAVVWRTPRKASPHMGKGDFCSIYLGYSNPEMFESRLDRAFSNLI